MSRVRVVISDNSRDFVELLVEYFSNVPEIELVGVAYDGDQTISIIEQTKPDVLLLDLIMPNKDGLEVLKSINMAPSVLQIYVISAVGNDKLIEMEMQLGVKQHFIKPVKLTDVLSAILKNRPLTSSIISLA